MGWGNFVHNVVHHYANTGAGRVSRVLVGDPTGAVSGSTNERFLDKGKHYSLWSNHDAHAAASKQREQQQQQAQNEHLTINQIRVMYGLPPTGHGSSVAAGTMAAANNKTYLDNILRGQDTTALDQGNHQLDNNFASALTANAQRLAGGGMAGSSADAEGKRAILGDFLKGQQNLGLAANNADQTARGALDDQRMELERQVKLGTNPDMGTLDQLGHEQLAIGQAYNNLVPQAIGGLFAQGADTYRDNTLAQAYGRAGMFGSGTGLKLGGGAGGSSSGSYSLAG